MQWENGEVDEEMSSHDLVKVYQQTPQSLGCCNCLDDAFMEKLLEVGRCAGNLLEARRINSFLKHLKSSLSVPNLRYSSVADICLQSLNSMITGGCESFLVAYNNSTKELKTLNHCVNPTREETEILYQYTVHEFIQKSLRHQESKPYYLMDSQNHEWMAIEIKLAENFYWSKRDDFQRYFVVQLIDKNKVVASTELDARLFREVSAETARAINVIWIRDSRKRKFKSKNQSMDSLMYEWRNYSINEICYNVIDSIIEDFPGCNMYVGLLQESGSTINYCASSGLSRMEGKKLHRGNGISFDVIDQLKSIVLSPEDLDKSKLLVEGSPIEVYYGKSKYRARLGKFRGHEKYDVHYEVDRRVEAAVDLSRIVPIHTAFRLKKFGKSELPFVCISVRHREKAIGILGIDTFNNVPKASYEKHPDSDALVYLEQMGRVLGANLDQQKKKNSLKALHIVAKNQFSEMSDVLNVTFDAIFTNLYFAEGIVAARFVYEEDEKDASLSKGLNILQKRGKCPVELEARMRLFKPKKSSLKSLQKYGDKTAWMLCKLRSEVRGGKGKIFIIGISTTAPITDPDYEFLETLQKAISGTLQNIVTHKANSEMRFEALHDIKYICDSWRERSKKQFFDAIVECAQTCFYNASMYVGIVGARNKEIKYILASYQSIMKGQVLTRSEEIGLSFRTIDNCQSLIVIGKSPDANKLKYFGSRQHFDFPYIGIPIVAHIDAVVGLLGVDGCEDPTGSDQMDDVVSFFGAIGTYISKAIRGYKADDARKKLRQIVKDCHGYQDGIRDIKNLILETLPFAKRIVEVVYEPKELYFPGNSGYDNDTIENTEENYLVLLYFVSAEIVSKHVKGAALECYWQSKRLFRTKLQKDLKSTPLTFQIPQSVEVDKAALQLVLTGSVDNSDREICRKSIGLRYLINSPVYAIEHDLDSLVIPDTIAASVRLITKVFSFDQLVGFQLADISVKSIDSLMTEDNSSISKKAMKAKNYFVLVKWNDDLLLKSSLINNVNELRWKDLGTYLKLVNSNLEENNLVFEVWDQDIVGKGRSYGQLSLNGKELRAYIEHKKGYMSLKPLSYMRSITYDPADYGTIKINCFQVKANTMNTNQKLQELDLGPKATLVAADVPEENKSYQLCELGVLESRDLGFIDSKGTSPNTFAIIYFNNEEIGRTSVRFSNVSPSWDDEYFTLRVPATEELELCSLLIKMHHINDDDHNPEELFLGGVEVSGKMLTALIAGTKMKRQWFDLADSIQMNNDSTARSSTYFIQGELKLSGRPLSVKVTKKVEDAKELGFAHLLLLSFSNLITVSGIAAAVETFAEVYFNNRLVKRTETVLGNSDGTWMDQSVTFRYPNSKSVFQCVLRIELWQSIIATGERSKICFLELSGLALSKLIGQKGYMTKWFPLSTSETAVITSGDSVRRENTPEIKLKGGPLGAEDIYEEDSRELWLDVLAASAMPSSQIHKAADSRPSTFCVVKWNEKVVGQTPVIVSAANPLWENQRFVLRIPVMEDEENSLLKCSLRIEMYDKTSDNEKALIGLVTLPGIEVNQFFNKPKAQIKWFKVKTSFFGDQINFGNDEISSEIKLRGGFAGVPVDLLTLEEEYSIAIVGARELCNVDAFGGADSYVVVEWMGKEIGKTQVVRNTINPDFINERFILRAPSASDVLQKKLHLSLSFLIWSKRKTSYDVFLGRVVLEYEKLTKFFSGVGHKKEFILEQHDQFDEEENELVGGKLIVSSKKMIYVTDAIIQKTKPSILWIKSAADLRIIKAFGIGSDVFFKVYRKFEMEGGEDVLVYTSNIVMNSLSPEFENEFITIQVPNNDDWTSFSLRVELWDPTEEFLGAAILESNLLKKILLRETIALIADTVVPLTDCFGYLNEDDQPVTGTLTFTGGVPSALQEFKRPPTAATFTTASGSPPTTPNRTKSGVGALLDKDFFKGSFRSPTDTKSDLLVVDENGDNAQITLHNVTKIPDSSMYCVVKWNGIEIGKTGLLSSIAHAQWENEDFQVKLPRDNEMSKINGEIEIWARDKNDDVVRIGIVHLREKEMQKLLDNPAKVIDLPYVSALTIRSSLFKTSTKQGNLQISCLIPTIHSNLQTISQDTDTTVRKTTTMNDATLSKSSIEVTVVKAMGLAKTNLISKGSDTYVALYWGESADAVGKTQVVSGSSEPIYDAEIFRMIKPAGVRFDDCRLKVVVYAKNRLKGDVAIGEVSISDELLADWVASETEREFHLISNERSRENNASSVFLSVRRLTDVDSSPVFNNLLPLPSFLKELEISVIAASGLGKANLFGGSSDPQCIINWGPVEIGKTSVINENLNPVWDEDHGFPFRVPRHLDTAETEKILKAQSRTHVSSLFANKFTTSTRFSSRRGSTRSTKSVNIVTAKDYEQINGLNYSELVLRIDVYDWNRIGKSLFLGCVELAGQELSEFISAGKFSRKWFDLKPSKRLKKQDQKLVQGKIQLLIMHHSDIEPDFDSKDVEVLVCAARNLTKLDVRDYQADPYVKIRWNGKYSGRTYPVPGTVSPSWEDERFVMRLPGFIDITNAELHLEVWNGKGRKDSLFGCVDLSGAALKDLVNDKSFSAHWYDLKTSNYIAEAIPSADQGQLQIRCGFVGMHEIPVDVQVTYKLSILQAIGLAKVEGLLGSCNPYVICKWNSREIGRTAVINKSIDPVWESENKFNLITSSNDEISDNILQLDVWNHKKLAKGEFLGSLTFTGMSLSQLFAGVTIEQEKLSTFDLTFSDQLDESRQKYVRGSLTFSLQEILDEGDIAGLSLSESINLRWDAAREFNAGSPYLLVHIHALQDCLIPTGSKTILPVVKITWMEELIATTGIPTGMDEVSDDILYEKEKHYLRIPPHADEENGLLVLSVSDLNPKKPEDYGLVSIDFMSLLRLYSGTFSLALGPKVGNSKKSQVYGKLLVTLRILYPYWDTIRPVIPKLLHRRLRILGASNLCTVNDALPNTKCLIKFDGSIKSKSIIVSGNDSPAYPQTQVDFTIDLTRPPIEIIVMVIHVDPLDKKEIVIGQESVQFDYLLRPPQAPFDLFLGPPQNVKKSSNYKYTVSGSVKVHIDGSNFLSEVYHPFCKKFSKPVASIMATDLRDIQLIKPTKVDIDLTGDLLSRADKNLLGSVSNFTIPQVVIAQPKWIVLPVHDPGLQIGKRRADIIGSKPGHKLALCIERQEEKLSASDPVLLDDIIEDVADAIVQLRQKDIYRSIREKAKKNLLRYIADLNSKDFFDVDSVLKLINEAMLVCFPGATITTALVAADFRSINYVIYSKDDTPNRKSRLHSGQGCDWELLGRSFCNSLVISTIDEFVHRNVVTFSPFPCAHFPRISVPLRSGDSAVGFYQIDGLDVHNGGAGEELRDASEICKWLEEIGDICGDSIYNGKELAALKHIENYYLLSDSSIVGLIRSILTSGFEIIQGCKLMEVISIDNNYNMKSLAEERPIGTKDPDNEVIVYSTVTCRTKKPSSYKRLLSVDSMMSKSTLLPPGKAVAVPKPIGEEESIFSGDESNAIFSRRSNFINEDDNIVEEQRRSLLFGIAYDGMEQVQILSYKHDEFSTGVYEPKPVPIVLQSERGLVINIYEVDEKLRISTHCTGQINFVDFKEKEMKISLTAYNDENCVYDVKLSFSWQKKLKNDVFIIDKKTIKAFNVKLIRVTDILLEDEANGNAPSDIYCELLLGEKVVQKSAIIKKSFSPEFGETFAIPYDSQSDSVNVDVYTSSFLGRGTFLGRVAISSDQWQNPPKEAIDYPLKVKTNMKAKKQNKVGGMAAISYNIEYYPNRAKKGVDLEDSELTVIPKDVWSMINPAVELSIKSARDLAKANRFSGASDPFVTVFVGSNEVPTYQTKVVDGTLSPEWNEVALVNLGVIVEKGVSVITDFPTIRLEVYHYNNVAASEFLGSCTIKPAVYFSGADAEFDLVPLPTTKKKNLVKGSISLGFQLIENVPKKHKQSYVYNIHRGLPIVIYLEVYILKAHELMKSSRVSGKRDPYVKVVWNGTLHGKTSYKRGTNSPVWTNEKIIVNISTTNFAIGGLSLEVWDQDSLSRGEFLGVVNVTADLLLHPPSGEQEKLLLPRQSADNSSKVQGSLTYRLVARTVKQLPKFDEIEAHSLETNDGTLDPVTLSVARDPNLEKDRQQHEGMNFPTILTKVEEQMNKYINNPFERVGLISELHFGQLTSAVRRADQTILKTKLSDVLCIPTFRKHDKNYMSNNNDNQHLYLVSRYDSNQLPRRDLMFLKKLGAIATVGMETINDRKIRAEERTKLLSRLTELSKVTDNPNEVVLQSMLEVETVVNSKTMIFLLDSDGITFFRCSLEEGKPDRDSPATDLVHCAAKLCRYETIIQFYDGLATVISYDWVKATQISLPLLKHLEATFDQLEGDGTTTKVLELLQSETPGGSIIIPLIAYKEVLMGMLIIDDINKLPCAIFRIEANTNTPLMSTKAISRKLLSIKRSIKQSNTTARRGTSVKIMDGNSDVVEMKRLEPGMVQLVRELGGLIGAAIYSSRLGRVMKQIRSFSINSNYTPALIIRYCFRLLATAIPAIREISIWAVDVNKEVELPDQPDDPNISCVNSSARRLFGINIRGSRSLSVVNELPDYESTIRSITVENMTKNANHSQQYYSVDNPPGVMAGYFGEEDPKFLLLTQVERQYSKGKKYYTQQYKRNNASNAVNEQLKYIAIAKEVHDEQNAQWRIGIPKTLLSQGNVAHADVNSDTSSQDDNQNHTEGVAPNGAKETTIEDNSQKTVNPIDKQYGSINNDAMKLIHAEVVRYFCFPMSYYIF